MDEDVPDKLSNILTQKINNEGKKSSILDQLNVNPFNIKAESNINREKLTYLQSISNLPNINKVMEIIIYKKSRKKVKFMSSNKSLDNLNKIQGESNKFDDRRKEEEIVIIDNQPYKKNQYDVLSKVVLKKCNFTHEKNKNNNVIHKTGDGKLMITSGLTIKDFIEKYHL